MYLPKVREIREALTSFFSAPYTSSFPKDGYTPPKEYRGFPKYDAAHCVGCGTCAQVCPSNAISMAEDLEGAIRTLRIDYTSCMQCGQCVEKCITGKGIQNSTHYSLSVSNLKAPEVYETIEKELVICEICGEVIGCKDHLLWVKERLGAKAYAHPTLMLQTQSLFFDVEPSKAKAKVRREDFLKTVCAKCRQEVVITDEF